MSTQLAPPQYSPVPNGLKAAYSVDFSVDTIYNIYLLSTYQGDAVNPVSLYVDNLNSDQDITVTMGGMPQKVPAYSSASLQINGASSVELQCNSSSTAQAAIDVLNYAIAYGTSSPGRGISPSLNNYPVSAPSYSVLNSSKGAGYIGFQRTETGAVLRTVQDKGAERISVLDYGADNTGKYDCSAAFADAIAAVKSLGGGVVYAPAGKYLFNGQAAPDGTLNGIAIPYTSDNSENNRVFLIGDGKSTIFLAGAANMIMLRVSDSHCGGGLFTIDGNGKAGIIAQALIPDDTTQTTKQVSQSYNYFSDVYILNCAEGLPLQCGPHVNGYDSGCYYNTFFNYHIFQCVRGIWLKSLTQGAVGSTVNRNKFINVRIGGYGPSNTGVQIDAGDTNTFIGVDCEGVNNATGPNATATGYIIKNTDPVTGASNQLNTFISCKPEDCTRDLDNANNYSEFIDCHIDGTKSNFNNTQPLIMQGGYDPSVIPQVNPAFVYQNAGFFNGIDQGVFWLKTPNGLAIPPNGLIYDQGFKDINYPLTTGNMTNVTSVTESQSKYYRVGGKISWHGRVQFQATNLTGNISITPPRTPATLYTSFTNVQPMLFTVTLQGASGAISTTHARWETNGTITIYAPSGGWNAGTYSEIHLMLDYFENGFI